MMTIREIAEISGCSPSTVSWVLANKKCSIPISRKTREKILAVCREHDYMPNINASRFFSKQSKIIGFLIPFSESLLDDNLARGMSAVYDALQQNSYRILPITFDAKFTEKREYLSLFKSNEIDAAIIWGACEDYRWIDELAANKMPFILLTNRYRNYPVIYCDDSVGIRQLIEHCRAKGAETFTYVAIGGGDCCLRRRTEFIKQVPNGKIVNGGINISDGERVAAEIMQQRPDAVICGNDRSAIGLEKALIASGLKVPDDIMITGADNIELAEYCPVPLTTYDQMAYECGNLCARMILDLLQNGKKPATTNIKPKLYIRNSA